MTRNFMGISGAFSVAIFLLCILLSGGCAGLAAPKEGGSGTAAGAAAEDAAAGRKAKMEPSEVEDLILIPQTLGPLAKAAEEQIALDHGCRESLLAEFRRNFFLPWTSPTYLTDPAKTRGAMKQQGKGRWFLVNKRRITPAQMEELIDNCDLERFPSLNALAIAVAPGHLRGLPTRMPFFERAESMPFDMLSYPQVKLNEPLRVLHRSRDGVWLFVESVYSNGWLEARDVALMDREQVDAWMAAPSLAVTRDYLPVADGRGVATYPVKLGTILRLAREGENCWEVMIASAGEGGKAVTRPVSIPRQTAELFPLAFNSANVALIGDQLLGEPYGWGEAYDLRDCSSLLRDFFLPFGIWLPRTSSDQIASSPDRFALKGLTAEEKEQVIREKSRPFLTLIFKPGHIVLYVGEDSAGRQLVFQNAWSIRVQEDGEAKSRIIGRSGITTMQAGKELGLAPGSSLMEMATDLGTITSRCCTMVK